jgi:hypothetical protein
MMVELYSVLSFIALLSFHLPRGPILLASAAFKLPFGFGDCEGADMPVDY